MNEPWLSCDYACLRAGKCLFAGPGTCGDEETEDRTENGGAVNELEES